MAIFKPYDVTFAIEQIVADELPGLSVRVDSSLDDPTENVRVHIDAPRSDRSHPTLRCSHAFSKRALSNAVAPVGLMREGVRDAIRKLKIAVPDLADRCAKALWDRLCVSEHQRAEAEHRARAAETSAIGWRLQAMALNTVLLGIAIREFAEATECLHHVCEFCDERAIASIMGADEELYPWCGGEACLPEKMCAFCSRPATKVIPGAEPQDDVQWCGECAPPKVAP